MYWSQYVPSQASKNPFKVDIQERLKEIFSFEYIQMNCIEMSPLLEILAT